MYNFVLHHVTKKNQKGVKETIKGDMVRAFCNNRKPHCLADERQQHRAMWYAYILMLVVIWAWQGFFLIFAVASHVDVACAVTSVSVYRLGSAPDFKIIANFCQTNTSRNTGNVTVLNAGNVTTTLAAEQAFAVGTIHRCVYARNKGKLYYEPQAPPSRDLPSLTVHIVVFAFLCVIIAIALLQMRQFTVVQSTPVARTPDGDPSLIVTQTGPSFIGGFADVELGSYHDSDEDDDVIFINQAGTATTENGAVLQ